MQTTGSPEPPTKLVGADRVLAVLSELARHPEGISLDEMSRAVGSPKPTVHRALAALRRAAFAVQDARGHYLLGDEYLRLAFAHHEARPDHLRVQPVLRSLAARYGETTHYAVLEDPAPGDAVIYRSKVDPPSGGARLTSVVGGRNPAHATAVGKLLLAFALPDDAAARAWCAGRTLAGRTPRTITSHRALVAELAAVRRQGYAVDDEENEPGIVCVAVPAYLLSPTTPSGAVSISALEYRTSLAELRAAVPDLLDSVGTVGPDATREV